MSRTGGRLVRCYKVCRREGNKLYSAIIDDDGLKLEYKINTIVRPKVGKIFAFMNLTDADRFNYRYLGSAGVIGVIFSCEGEYSKEQPNVTPNPRPDLIKSFWGKRLWEEPTWEFSPNPDGTIFLDNIKLLEEVQSWSTRHKKEGQNV